MGSTSGSQSESRGHCLVVHACREFACDAEHTLGLRGTVAREAARRRDEPARPQGHRIASRARVSSHHTDARCRQCGSADSPTGRSVGTAPHATQPSPSRKRASATVSRTRSSSTSTPSTCGPASSARADVAVAADVHPGDAVDRRERTREHVDGRLAVDARRRPRRQATSAGSSKKMIGRGVGKLLAERAAPA